MKCVLTESEARYLKTIYRILFEGSGKVSTSSLAEFHKVRPATVTEVIQNLWRKNLVEYRRYKSIRLTRKGVREARRLLRKHRILEVLFANFLKYDVRRACEEASKLDFHVSADLIEKICEIYGHPRVCPCGRRIFEDPACGRSSA